MEFAGQVHPCTHEALDFIMSALVTSFIAVVALALIQLASGRLSSSRFRMNRAWLSFTGGMAVGYVFLHILPELAAEHAVLAKEWENAGIASYAIYFTALVGLTLFFTVERTCSLVHRAGHHGALETVLHYGSFVIFNAVIGYVSIQRAELGTGLLLLFFGAIGPHILLNTHSLQDKHEENMQIGRWALSLALLVGWCLGALAQLPAATQSFLFAFLAGGIILNALQEELPAENDSRLWAFLLGLVIYGAIIFLIVKLFPSTLEHA
jgi:hypothetical protein